MAVAMHEVPLRAAPPRESLTAEMEIQDDDIVAREYRPGRYHIQRKQGSRLVTIDYGRYTEAEADRIAIQTARDDGADAFRLKLNGLVKFLEV
jgi:hypothetical protein